jgi:imidazolonepropionase-like amidohydrolase
MNGAGRWTVTGTVVGGARAPQTWSTADGVLVAGGLPGAAPLPGAWISCGMVDAHAHLTFEARDRLGLTRGTPALIDAHLELQRAAGVLAVRDAGALPGVTLDPRPAGGGQVIACGPFLGPPDFYYGHLMAGTPPAEVAAFAAAQVEAGSPWAKIIVDAPPPGGTPLEPVLGYELSVVAEIVAAVHEAGGRVAAHIMGQIVDELIECGVDSVEHANWAQEDTVRELAARGIAWCPTLGTVAGHLEPIAEHVPPARALLEHQRTTLPLAAELGVTLLTGTDEEPHGSIADEVATLIRYGLPPDAAVRAAGEGARAFLGLPGLVAGAPADLVTYDADPVADPSVLARPAAVVCGGRRVR